MFDSNMQIRDGNKLYPLVMYATSNAPLPMVFQFWMAEVARDHLRLGVYFRAVAIMLQIPGAAEYEWVGGDSFETECDTEELIDAADQTTLLNVLAVCLDRLGVKELMEQVPAPDYSVEELSDAYREFLDKREKVKNGLLTVVAECLDKLVVEPGMAEIGEAAEQRWWHRWKPEP